MVISLGRLVDMRDCLSCDIMSIVVARHSGYGVLDDEGGGVVSVNMFLSVGASINFLVYQITVYLTACSLLNNPRISKLRQLSALKICELLPKCPLIRSC